MRSDTDGRSLALIVLWVVGIAVMLMPLFMDWVSVDAVLVDGDAVSSMSGLDAMMGRGAEAVPGGFMAMVIVWSALSSAVMAVVTWFDVRIGFIGDEFKSCREHLYQHLDGNAAWRYGSRENVRSHISRTGNGGNAHEED